MEYQCSASSNKFERMERQVHCEKDRVARLCRWPMGIFSRSGTFTLTLTLTVSFCIASRWPCLQGTFPCGNTSSRHGRTVEQSRFCRGPKCVTQDLAKFRVLCQNFKIKWPHIKRKVILAPLLYAVTCWINAIKLRFKNTTFEYNWTLYGTEAARDSKLWRIWIWIK